jgi:hypothetical protein
MTFDLTKLIFHKKNVFTTDEAQFLIEEYDKLEETSILEHCADANTGIDTFSTFKRVRLVEGSEAFKLVFTANENLINEYMDYLESFKMFHVFLRRSMNFSHMLRLLKYEPGAKIHPHTDHIPFVYGSATFNLNDDYTGGDFVFWNGKHRVKLEAREAMIWPADYFWVHEVEEILTGCRYSTNSFLLSAPHPLIEDAMATVQENSKKPEIQEYARAHYYNTNKKI